MKITHEVAVVVLTDRVGRVLMQHRGPDKRVEPGRWGPPCGLVEPGEDALTAAHRELLEETGLTAALEPCRVVEQVGGDGIGVRFHVFEGSTDARNLRRHSNRPGRSIGSRTCCPRRPMAPTWPPSTFKRRTGSNHDI
jgi:8-oxo-dGTP pyrophosphatase MutT (NUDIX family)